MSNIELDFSIYFTLHPGIIAVNTYSFVFKRFLVDDLLQIYISLEILYLVLY